MEDRDYYTQEIVRLEQEISDLTSQLRAQKRNNEQVSWFNHKMQQEMHQRTEALRKARQLLESGTYHPQVVSSVGRFLEVTSELAVEERRFPLPRGLGRLPAPDPRDMAYGLAAAPALRSSKAALEPNRRFRYWWPSGWWGDQGYTPHCVGYAWSHLLEDGPTTHRPFGAGQGPIIDPYIIYRQAQTLDEWAGEQYDGTSVRAGAKYLQREGLIRNYFWIHNLNDLAQTVLHRGPVVAGTWWYEDMFWPDELGFIKPTGWAVGGHAFLINGVNLDRKVFRIKNSWGRTWGKIGHAYVSFDDMQVLMYGGEFCYPHEVKLAA